MNKKFSRILQDMTGLVPSRGLCHAVFLLNRAARLREMHSLEEWVALARRQSTFMAAALNLEDVAKVLLDTGLASATKVVSLTPRLEDSWQLADKSTFLRIARVLMEAAPPYWIDTVFSKGQVQLEYIPADDFAALQWIEDDLVGIILAAGADRFTARDNKFARRIGEAAELVVVRGKQCEPGDVVHVSRISDSFGYDVEHRFARIIARIEVKGCVESTADGFFITRNEMVKAKQYGEEWILVQVIFRSTIALKDEIDADDVFATRCLSSDDLCSLVPSDTPHFSWAESARIRPPGGLWRDYRVLIAPSVRIEASRYR